MKMKMLIPILLAFFVLSPGINVLAASGGIFHGVTITSNTGAPITWATDNNNSTGSNIRNSPLPVFQFTEPTNINKYYMVGGGCIQFYSDLSRTKLIHKIATGNGAGIWIDVDVKNVMSISVSTCGAETSTYLYEMDFKSPVPIEYLPVTNIIATSKTNSILLSWINPSSEEFRGVEIKQDGKDVTDLKEDISNHNVTGLLPETSYSFEIVAKYSDGVKSMSQTVVVKTDKEAPIPEPEPEPEPAGDVIELKAVPTHKRVDLSWTLPASNNFKHVNIYRETLKKSFFDKMLGINIAMAATPIFETNGTYFNDLTVESETKYEYTLTTTSIEKLESDGVSVIVTTLEDPTPEIGGGGYDKDPESGDYTYYWTKPTTGKVKVMVGGKLYATVAASDGKIVIPADKMKFTLFGSPDVQLIPVDEEGNEGKPVKPPSGGENGGGENGGGIGESELPFSGSDLIKATFDFIKILGPIILLFLIIHLTPRLIKVIRSAIKNKGVDVNAK